MTELHFILLTIIGVPVLYGILKFFMWLGERKEK